MNYPPPQYPSYPPQQPQQVPQQYAQPMAPAYPPQQFPQQGYAPAPAPQPAQPLVQGSLDDFYNQPSSGGGPSLKFEQIGTRYIGIVSRPIGAGDVQQQTNTQGVPLFFKDGRPKFVMKVPLQMQPSPAYPDGVGQWYVKGGARDELSRAMAEAGAPPGAPEAGAILDITFVATRASGAGMNPAKVFQVVYTRPDGAAPAQPAAPAVAQQQVPQAVPDAPSPAPGPAPQAQPQGQVYATPAQAVQQPIQQQVPAPAPQVQQQPPVAQAPQPQPPSDLSPEQQALLAKLTGGQG